MNSKVTIIILNWNGFADTLKCLESISNINYKYFDIIIVDNNSSDDSVELINKWSSQSSLHHKINILVNDQNHGFAKGNNIAIDNVLKKGDSNYVLLLNNDTVVHDSFLGELVSVMDADLRIGVVGPKIYNLVNGQKTSIIQSLGGDINLLRGDVSMIGEGRQDFYSAICDVGYLRGAAIMIRCSIFKEIGLLEEKYFAYFEETDFCLKTRSVGYKIKNVPKAIIWHKGMGSFSKITGFSLYLMTRNLFWFEKKHASSAVYVFFVFYYFLIKFPRKILFLLFFNKYDKNLIIKYFMGIKDGIFKKI